MLPGDKMRRCTSVSAELRAGRATQPSGTPPARMGSPPHPGNPRHVASKALHSNAIRALPRRANTAVAYSDPPLTDLTTSTSSRENAAEALRALLSGGSGVLVASTAVTELSRTCVPRPASLNLPPALPIGIRHPARRSRRAWWSATCLRAVPAVSCVAARARLRIRRGHRAWVDRHPAWCRPARVAAYVAPTRDRRHLARGCMTSHRGAPPSHSRLSYRMHVSDAMWRSAARLARLGSAVGYTSLLRPQQRS
jgi:hypothetical protein